MKYTISIMNTMCDSVENSNILLPQPAQLTNMYCVSSMYQSTEMNMNKPPATRLV